jgi:hypothetical protein
MPPPWVRPPFLAPFIFVIKPLAECVFEKQAFLPEPNHARLMDHQERYKIASQGIMMAIPLIYLMVMKALGRAKVWPALPALTFLRLRDLH